MTFQNIPSWRVLYNLEKCLEPIRALSFKNIWLALSSVDLARILGGTLHICSSKNDEISGRNCFHLNVASKRLVSRIPQDKPTPKWGEDRQKISWKEHFYCQETGLDCFQHFWSPVIMQDCINSINTKSVFRNFFKKWKKTLLHKIDTFLQVNLYDITLMKKKNYNNCPCRRLRHRHYLKPLLPKKQSNKKRPTTQT